MSDVEIFNRKFYLIINNGQIIKYFYEKNREKYSMRVYLSHTRSKNWD